MGILSVFASCQNTKTIFMLRDINFPILLILILAQEVMKPKLLEDCKYQNSFSFFALTITLILFMVTRSRQADFPRVPVLLKVQKY